MTKPWYIVVEGAIGVGKTTLARMLREHFGVSLLLEVFEENPFLAQFYQSRQRYAFQTQMFFLLSRYRQQKQHVPQTLSESALISDYMFAKDRLFAQLNLKGDEWEIYQQLHNALAEQIPTPDLVIYLQASTDVLMARIAQRDRPYERDMDYTYIDQVRLAYESFFSQQRAVPVLAIDTSSLNFVTQPDDFQYVIDRVQTELQEGIYQRRLPEFEAPGHKVPGPRPGGSLSDLQQFHTELDQLKGFKTNLYYNYLRLSEEIGELGSELAELWREEDRHLAQGRPSLQARRMALARRAGSLESELADCMAYLLKLANYSGIDLERAYLTKMEANQNRNWPGRGEG
jgi:deoxyadenosine/deoxycytidine kinase/NTP pyrophosphatase (non-canonical NTP hydrolase)